MGPITLVDLPEDVLVLIFPYLEITEFLSLCAVNRHFYNNFLKNPDYWRERTSKAFRVPIHPLLRADGARWFWLYRNLRTRTKVLTWGAASRGAQGKNSGNVLWPREMVGPKEIGTIVDLQCGGWSTAFLTSDGLLYLVGIIDGASRYTISKPEDPPLAFPGSFPASSKDAYEPATAIRQFSSGRRHILGLSDDGRIWSWHDNANPAHLVKFNNVETKLGTQNTSKPGTVNRIVAGWETNSAFIIGTGIVYWDRSDGWPLPDEDELHISCHILPETDFRRSDPKGASGNAGTLGEVRNYTVLCDYIVFITDLNKVFAAMVKEQRMVELSTFRGIGREFQDIQGAFQRFAVFTSAGEVLLGDIPLIEKFFSPVESDDLEQTFYPEPGMPICLQHNNVISVAFGDYHFAALHANGKISTYGTEPQGCGALGLGSLRGGMPFRSLTFARKGGGLRNSFDVQRFPFAEDSIRYVWFEHEKELWLEYLYQQSQEGTQAQPWLAALNENRQGLLERYSSCIEREGESWDDFPDIKEQDPDGLGAYFALSVAAAGWHCAALVLVNEDLAEKVRAKHILDGGDKIGSNNLGKHITPILHGVTRHNANLTRVQRRPLLLTPNQDAEGLRKSNGRSISYDLVTPGDRPTQYRWQLQKFPPIPISQNGELDVGKYDFDGWRYGLPPADPSS